MARDGARRAGRVVVVGSINADLVVRVEHHPRPGETVLGGDVHRYPGGKGDNQAVAAARLGADVAFVGCVGSDEAGGMLAANLRDAGVDPRTLRVDDGAPSGVALIDVEAAGENTIVVSPGANMRVAPGHVDAAFDALGDVAVACLQCELPPETVHHAARAAAGRGVRVVLNAAPPMPLEADVLSVCDPLVVNVHEAAYLLGGSVREGDGGAERTVERLRRRGPRSVVVTLGKGGAVGHDRRGVFRLPAPAVEALDTTGAGDAFTGALAARLAEGSDLREATAFAVKVGAAAVRAHGAQGSFPTRDEIAKL
ncbi:MAG: ribokinase [Streptosporangiaceae bacterium]